MAKRRVKPKVKRAFRCFIAFILFGVLFGYYTYKIETGPVSKESKEIVFSIQSGDTYLTIAPKLKESGLVRSTLFYKIYIKLQNPTTFEAGTYHLNQNMGLNKIVEAISKGSYNTDNVMITFPEGKNMRSIASLIASYTNHSEKEVFTLLQDEVYLDELIATYWFLTDDIKNKEIYYSLEGYLFPDTYEFLNANVDIKEIFKVMLNQTEKKLEPYKESILNSSYSIHQIMTLASIVELEAASSDDRSSVARVFYNRLESNWNLGSDVTTYYAAKVDMSERDLYQSELDDYNAYNTRSVKMAGKLPVGPICNPGIESIAASISPEDHDYLFFVADKNKKTYFSKTSKEHEQIVAKLKKDGLWYEY